MYCLFFLHGGMKREDGKSEVRRRKPEDRGQKSEVRSRKFGVGWRNSEPAPRISHPETPPQSAESFPLVPQ